MAHGYLTCISDQDIEANCYNGMNGDEIDSVDGHPQKVIFLNEKGEDSEKDEKENRPNEDGVAFKKFNIFVIIALYIHESLSDGGGYSQNLV
jgi:hypothetical protein